MEGTTFAWSASRNINLKASILRMYWEQENEYPDYALIFNSKVIMLNDVMYSINSHCFEDIVS